MYYKNVTDWIKTMLVISRRDCDIEVLMKNLLDQSQIGWGEDNTTGNTSASEAKMSKTKSGLEIDEIIDKEEPVSTFPPSKC